MMHLRRVIVASTLLCFLLIITGIRAGSTRPATPQLSYVSQKDGANWHIHLMDTRHRLEMNLTRHLFPGNARSRVPTWSPDGEQLAFISDGGRGNHVYILDMTTWELRQMTNEDHTYSSISWSPDGTQIVVSESLHTQTGVLLIDATDGSIATITPTGMAAAYVHFAPQTTNIVHAYTLQTASGIRITTPDDDASANVIYTTHDPFASHSAPSWSHDGQYVAFTVGNLRLSQNSLCVLKADEADTQACNELYALPGNIAWAPHELSIAYAANNLIFLIDDAPASLANRSAHLSPIFLFESAPQDQLSGLAWHPSGAAIAFRMSSQLTLESEIYMLDLDTGRTRRLTFNDRNNWSAVWRPAS